jgi:hypothetical protein
VSASAECLLRCRETAEILSTAMVIVHHCHGTVLGPHNLTVSGDIIGAGIEALEAGTGAEGRCAWAQGAAGDVSTRGSRQGMAQSEAQRLGSIVAGAAEDAAGRAEPVPGGPALRLERAVVPLPLKSPRQLTAPSDARPPSRDEDDRSEAALFEEAMVAQRARAEGTRML